MARPPITRARPYTPASGLVAGQTFSSERQYRNALARARGYPSWAARQRTPRTIATAAELERLRPSEELARLQAFEAIGYMRRQHLSLTQAADRAGTTPAAVLRHAGAALIRMPGGRYRVSERDSLLRVLPVLTTQGVVILEIRDSREASLVGQHWSLIGQVLNGRNPAVLRPFARRRIQGYRFETDPDRIEELGRRGELRFEDIYRLPR